MEKALATLLTPITFVTHQSFRAFKWVTGKDSIAFAWVMMFIMEAFSMTTTFYRHYDSSWLTTYMIMEVLWLACAIFLTMSYKKHCDNMSKAETLTMFRWLPSVVFLAIWDSMSLFISLALLYFPGVLDNLFTAMWCITLTMYKPGGKSVFSRVKAKAVAAIEARPQLAPSPIPI